MKKKILMMMAFIVFTMNMMMASVTEPDPDLQEKRPNFAEMQLNQVLCALKLDDKTAARFIPVYKKYQQDMWNCRRPRIRKKPSQMTDEDIRKDIEGQFAEGRKMIDVKEKYYKQFKKILNMKQIQLIYRVERMNMQRLGREFERRDMHQLPVTPKR